MEESQNFGHVHPLVMLNEKQIRNQSEKVECSRCGEEVSDVSFSCLECGFYLHKKCAKAPLEINHPFHRDHPLVLLPNSPSGGGEYICDFCDRYGKTFHYQCSCGLDFHIKCALFTYNIAEKNLRELEHVALEDPLISTENNGDDLTKCFACWEPLANFTYFSLDCGFNLHKKCADLPLKINDMGHRHPLALEFNSRRLSCQICLKTEQRGFVYCCSPCNFVVHIECVLPPPAVEVKSHPHAFLLFRRRVPFICDACGTEGNYAAYICCTCNIIVHKKCTSLPCIIKSKWHDDHFLFHKYFLQEEDFKTRDCLICHEEVNVKHGSYYCSYCKIILHVNCATKEKEWYYIVSLKNDEKFSDSLALFPDKSIDSINCVIERNDAGEATKIKHFKHMHNLMLSDKIAEYDKCCDGCMLPLSTSFYYCSSQCDFFLHKACAELPQMKDVWYHFCRQPLSLTSDHIFQCYICEYQSNGFAYKCTERDEHVCLRCVIALSPGYLTCPGHKHPLLFYFEYEGQCSACGEKTFLAFRCKECNFTLDYRCVSLPTTARHKCDEHLLALTYQDGNNYSESHYCDICEEKRDPNHWFYHCVTCDTSAHVNCVLGKYRFMKLGSICQEKEDHPHPLIYVKKIYYYPNCTECGEPCQDLGVECAECNYIVHWECTKSYYL